MEHRCGVDAAACVGAVQWTQILDILQEAGLGGAFALRLCEQLLLQGAVVDGKEVPATGWLEDKQACILAKPSCDSKIFAQKDTVQAGFHSSVLAEVS